MATNTHIIPRHPGAIEWLKCNGVEGDVIDEFDIEMVVRGHIYIGVLPVHLVEQVISRGGRFIMLVMPVIPYEKRGQELTPTDMDKCGAKLLEVDSITLREVTAAWR